MFSYLISQVVFKQTPKQTLKDEAILQFWNVKSAFEWRKL